MMENGRRLTVFGAGYKADLECPLSIGGAIKPVQPSIGAKPKPKPLSWLSPAHCHKLLRTAYNVQKHNTTSTLLFRVPSCNSVT